MKVFWNKKNLWNKALNIINLNKNNFNIPKTIIFEKNSIFFFKWFRKCKKYIIRPSFSNEDLNSKSLAWYYKSFVFNDLWKLNDFINQDIKIISKLFWWTEKYFKSIIIQEFIETNIYWVFFTKSPENVLTKWFYEIWAQYNNITSWKNNKNFKLNFIAKKELEIIWNKLEKHFNFPQDIEFCINNKIIYILQTRNITTWNNTIYNYSEIQKFHWIYQTLDFDELSDKQDLFSYEVLKNIFNIIFINWNIYFKKIVFPYFYFKNYKYSFLLKKESNLILNFEYKNCNYITKQFLKIEKQKNNAFKYLEKYKNEYKGKKLIENEQNLPKKLIIKNWVIINFLKKEKIEFKWIYKWTINWNITNLKNFKYKKNLNQILIVNNLDFNLYNKLEYIDWLIVKNWNLLSHNSIILREYKIPSLIKYKKFDLLKNWEKIILK